MSTFQSIVFALLCATGANAFAIAGVAAPHRSPTRAQTLTPGAPTITKPDALPETWVVPDTFTFPKPKSEEPPFFRLTLFKSSHDADYVATSLIKIIGIDTARANEIAGKAQSLGFSTVGEWVQEVAEMYAAALQEQGLVVDVSETM